MLAISRRTADLGTENAFVVLAEVNDLVRQGKDIISFCIGQPDFPRRPTSKRPRSGDPRRMHGYTPSAGIVGAARGRCALHEHDARSRDPSRGRRRRRRREAVHRLRDPRDYRLRRGRRGDLSRSRASRSTNRRSRRTARWRCRCTCAKSRNFAFDPAELEAKLRPRTKLVILNSPHNPDRRHARATRPRGDRCDSAEAPGRLGICRRDLLAALYEASSHPSRRSPACTSARSSPTARRRPGR